jgi:pyridoxal 5'-phosphate synthase pdxT subunit
VDTSFGLLRPALAWDASPDSQFAQFWLVSPLPYNWRCHPEGRGESHVTAVRTRQYVPETTYRRGRIDAGPDVKVGVLALQGASARHSALLARLGTVTVPIRTPAQLDDIDALVMPGGESTTMSMLLESSGLFHPIADRLAGGMPVFGTCAGMILLGSAILDGRDDQRCYGVLDARLRRNAYGRQVDSFEADVMVPVLEASGLGTGPFRAMFIRAPVVTSVGPHVEVLARVDDQPVLCRQGSVLAAAFHPELGDDLRIHELFLSMG